jgi:DeoR/GlpR family transcriptional regulator of sugar metabolism
MGRNEDVAGPNPSPRKAERRRRILVELRLRPHVRTGELAALLGVTTETIRRDMDELSRLGKLSRSFGGAVAIDAHPNLDVRDRSNLPSREAIARRAAALVREGETLMIDAGSTTLQLARVADLARTAATVITNSLRVAAALAPSPAPRIVLCPGDYLMGEAAVIGTETTEFLRRFHVDRAFVGASALSERGVTEVVPGFAEVKRAMLAQARETHLLIDSSKFGNTHMTLVGRLGEFRSILSDRLPDDALLARCRAAGVELIVP